ncbi:hypothetical protein Hdeb2414_s0007g00243491 [Helianthus debilis subsp. tardiflorus]
MMFKVLLNLRNHSVTSVLVIIVNSSVINEIKLFDPYVCLFMFDILIVSSLGDLYVTHAPFAMHAVSFQTPHLSPNIMTLNLITGL